MHTYIYIYIAFDAGARVHCGGDAAGAERDGDRVLSPGGPKKKQPQNNTQHKTQTTTTTTTTNNNNINNVNDNTNSTTTRPASPFRR